MDEAFNRLRAHARNHNEGLTELATRVVERTMVLSELDEWVRPAHA
jgi:AmiR/NasT family two-component response regulator